MKQFIKNSLIVLSLIVLVIVTYNIMSATAHAKTKVGTVKIGEWYDYYWYLGEAGVGDDEKYTINWKKVKDADGYQVKLYKKENKGDDWYK